MRCVPDARCDEIFPNQLPAVLRVRLHDGRELERRTDVNRGGPQNPLSDEEIATKFEMNARRHVSEELIAQLSATVLALPEAVGLEPLTRLLRAAAEHSTS